VDLARTYDTKYTGYCYFAIAPACATSFSTTRALLTTESGPALDLTTLISAKGTTSDRRRPFSALAPNLFLQIPIAH
jgi:hypothetical protein